MSPTVLQTRWRMSHNKILPKFLQISVVRHGDDDVTTYAGLRDYEQCHYQVGGGFFIQEIVLVNLEHKLNTYLFC